MEICAAWNRYVFSGVIDINFFHIDWHNHITRSGSELNVAMGCFDGVEAWELVELYLISQLNSVFENENVGL